MFKLREIIKKFLITHFCQDANKVHIYAIFRSTLNIGPMPREDVS